MRRRAAAVSLRAFAAVTLGDTVEFGLLGPFEVLHRGMAVELRGRTYRKILALLLLETGRAVSISRLEDALWDGTPPTTAPRQVRNRVASLRRILAAAGDDPIQAVDGGYRISPDHAQCDVARFTAELRRAAESAAAGHLAPAVTNVDYALSLWRGSALMGVPGRVFESAAARLEESRLAAIERRYEWKLSLGGHEQMVGELSELVNAQPYRQRMVGQLMQALHLSGRTAEALGVYSAFRDQIIKELGIEPSRSLQELYVSILRDEDVNLAGLTGSRITVERPAPHGAGRFYILD